MYRFDAMLQARRFGDCFAVCGTRCLHAATFNPAAVLPYLPQRSCTLLAAQRAARFLLL